MNNYKSNIIVRLIFLFLMLLSFTIISISQELWQGDLGIRNYTYTPIKARIFARSIPFDGLTMPNTNSQYNRFDTLQNGSYCRYFKSSMSYELYQLFYYYSYLDRNPLWEMQLGLVGGNPMDTNNGFGHGIYEINIEIPSLNKKYKAYFNFLDSKYGSSVNGNIYGNDFNFNYYGGSDDVIVTATPSGWSDTLRPYFESQLIKEYKVWEIIFPDTLEPLEKRFYARTTPFGISPYVIKSSSIRNFELRNFFIGTKVIFDHVYDNYGELDRWGYNTVIDNYYQDYYRNPRIPNGHNSQGNTYTTPGFYYLKPDDSKQYGCKLIALPGDELVLKYNKRLWITGNEENINNIGDTLVLNQGSIVTLESEAQLNACFSGRIMDYGAVYNWNSNAFSKVFNKSSISFYSNNHVVNNGAHIEIDGGAKLTLADNALVTFDGAGTYLKLNPNSLVHLGENAKIEFKNGAYLIANGSAISSAQGSHGWGIVLENAGELTSITNCTFTNLKNSIFVKNTDSNYYGVLKNITNNTFYTDASCNYVIETKNANNITISNNHIYMMQGKGVGILMRYYINEGNEEIPSISYAVNVMGNEISNGVVSAAFISFTNSYPYINFKYNNCYGNVSTTNLAYRQSHGIMKDNFIANNSGKNLDLIQAHPDVLSNSFYSYIMNLTNNDSYPHFAPVSNNSSDGGWIWRGGNNTLTSTSNGNIYYNNGNVMLDWGQNCFSKGSNYHLQGRINEPEPHIYYVRYNNFNGSNEPSTSLLYYYSDTVVIPYYIGSTFVCNTSDAGTIWSIEDLGNGFYDTLYRTYNNSGYQPDEDEGLYSSASVKKLNDDYYGAVSTFKTLINAYPQSSYTEACLYTLYDCYLKLDTSANQSTHDILYSDLKYFLDSKIASGLYSDEFNLNAYNISVMCLASISEYYEAMSGYEFIALYHPDEYLSFLASWDYAEIEDLMNGSGGISSMEESLTQEEYYQKLKKRIDSKINEDPVKKMVKKSFDRTKAEKISKIEKDATSRTNSNETAKQEVARMKSKYEEAKMKAVSIMRTSKSLTREEKDRKQIEDLLLTKTEENKESATFSNIVPSEYSLSQNYPNPFNPVTKINFALPKQGFVTLKIYDITGREIKTLVNEFKQEGYYTVDFNGSHLSSGVYFYRIQSGNFVSVKRMVLIK